MNTVGMNDHYSLDTIGRTLTQTEGRTLHFYIQDERSKIKTEHYTHQNERSTIWTNAQLFGRTPTIWTNAQLYHCLVERSLYHCLDERSQIQGRTLTKPRTNAHKAKNERSPNQGQTLT
ncbi:hypothetical protein VIGAN_04083400 [Vigna angularis var. angularis]|uniref:Uncharacterized protein n=1 Tax=Vigna angularis var. angularis TaxID=157739 RepID=A0A0S3RST6_PHAAN|nr:hypothetical protein VIGAN_04083400 [Vigna angularis var. angularis]